MSNTYNDNFTKHLLIAILAPMVLGIIAYLIHGNLTTASSGVVQGLFVSTGFMVVLQHYSEQSQAVKITAK